MGRGGYRRPPPNQPPSGVGKYSTRQDGNQPPRTPNVGDSPDLQYGDRQKLEASQRVAPIPQSQPANVSSPGPSPRRAGGSAQMPAWMFNRPSDRGGEPVTTGMPMGPGPGPEALQTPEPEDDQDVVLQWLVDTFGDEAALAMLQEKRAARTAMPAMDMSGLSAQLPEPVEPEPEEVMDFPVETVMPVTAEEPTEEVL